VVRVQKLEYFFMSLFSAPILKHFNVYVRGIVLAKARGQLDPAMDKIVVPDRPAHESDDDSGRIRQICAGGNRGRRSTLSKREQAREKKKRYSSPGAHRLYLQMLHHMNRDDFPIHAVAHHGQFVDCAHPGRALRGLRSPGPDATDLRPGCILILGN